MGFAYLHHVAAHWIGRAAAWLAELFFVDDVLATPDESSSADL